MKRLLGSLCVLVLILIADAGRAQAPLSASPSTAAFFELLSRVTLLQEPSVQAELKLSPEQISQVGAMRTALNSVFGQRSADRDAREAELQKQLTEKRQELQSLLRPEQTTRLRQITWQSRRTSGLGNLVSGAELREELKLSAEQINQLQAIQQKLADQRRGLNRADRDAYTAKNKELLAATDQEVEALLTAEQNGRLKDLLGPPFTGEIRSRGFGGAPAAPFSLGTAFSPSISLLRSPQVQQDLKLDAQQQQKAAAIGASPGGDPLSQAGFLSPQQLERLNQLTWRYAEQIYGPLAALRYRAVTEALALSEEQRSRVFQIDAESRKEIAALGRPADAAKMKDINGRIQEQFMQTLSEQQRETFTRLRGVEFAGVLSVPRPPRTAAPEPAARPSFTIGAMQRRSWPYLRDADVQKDLQLTEDQRKQLPIDQVSGEYDDEKLKFLTAEQRARLSQVHLQLLQRRSGPAYIFRYRDVAEAMQLNDDQKQRIVALADGGIGVGNGRTGQPLSAILTEEQQATLQKLLGKPFEGQGDTRGGSTASGPPDRAPAPSPGIGEWSRSSWNFLGYPDVQRDLQLSAEQLQNLAARLSQIQLQNAQRQSGPAVVFYYRDVIETLKLTEEQKTGITALLGQARAGKGPATREQIAEILTEEQEAALQTLLGKPFEGNIPARDARPTSSRGTGAAAPRPGDR